MLTTSFILIVMALICVESFQMHEQMTDEELKSVFPMKDRQVPEYEIISIRHTAHEREFLGASVQFQAFGKHMEFYLNHRDDVLISTETRLYTAQWNRDSQNNVHYTMINNFPDNYYVYQDAQQHAAFIIHEDEEGQFLFDGTLGSNIVLSSIPGHVQKSILYRRNHSDVNDVGNSYPHVVYKVSDSQVHQVADLSFDIPTSHRGNSRYKRDIPNSIHPQIISVIDYNLYHSIGGDVNSAWKYILSFWNGVDLRYKTIPSPKIRLNIAAVVIAMDPWALQYLANHHVHPSALYINNALDNVATYFYSEERFPHESYDVVITLTQSKLCTRKVFPNCYPILGAAFTGGACGRNYFHGKFYGTAIVNDDGGYNGILTAAHELGHLLGAKHDGQSLDAIHCSSYEGYLMSPSISLHENGWKWSSCSIAAFHRFLTNENTGCLRNVPVSNVQYPRILPGELLSLDEQCRRNFGTGSCPGVASSCAQLRCVTPGNPSLCITKSPPAEGSSCGNGMICLNGRCARGENSNPWPYY